MKRKYGHKRREVSRWIAIMMSSHLYRNISMTTECRRSVGEEMELLDRRSRFKDAKMVLASVNQQEEARLFFNEYDIPFQITASGQNKGKLRVLPMCSKDRKILMDVKKILKENGLDWVVDHSNVFRDENDNTVVTFSPYQDVRQLGGIMIGGFEFTYSERSIYGYGTYTVVARKMY